MVKQKHYPETSNSPDFPKLEAQVLSRWAKEDTFRQSVEMRPEKKAWVFYDGPPFANGLPHYGHLLTSAVKDIFARYHTMKGSRVERRFGWDCHGLPAEMGAEKELGVSGRKAIENFGIARFNDHCRASVMQYTHEWERYVTRAARWVDFEHDYKTMDTDYMESVLWAFKELWKKDLVYESYRVMPYSWAAETPLSNFETRMDDAYRDRTDKAVTVAFKLKERPQAALEGAANYYILAWTTTPWTLPSNLALAVKRGMEAKYVSVKKNKDVWICSIDYLKNNIAAFSITEKEQEKVASLGTTNLECELNDGIKARILWGEPLLGLAYEPLFPYFAEKKNEWSSAFTILDGSDFIEEGSGTGVVHLAPGFGEDDQRVCAANGIGIVCPVDESGKYTNEIFDIDGEERKEKGENESVSSLLPPLFLKGLNVLMDSRKDEVEPYNEKQLESTGLANLRIITWLKERGQLIKQEDYKHSYPHCWRTDMPLIYKAVPSWYVEVTKFRDRMVELNQQINWIPEHIKDGQFGKWLEGARDWSISRNRFWGCPIPVWRTESGKIKVFGSIAELEEFFGVDVPDLHKPFIDELTKEENGETWRRVPDVFDCWFESGSMPFAQVHYPFENKEWFHDHFPADFIVEYVGQTRGWFYTLMVLGTALFDKPPFKNCICHGVILDANGKKLSKKLRNYPDPFEMFDLYGADAMRWRMIKEPVMHGGNLLIRKDGNDIRDVVRLSIKPIWNAYHFFCLYANADGVGAQEISTSNNLMDKYILAKLKSTVNTIENALDRFMTPEACKAVDDFFEVLNNWYIRRSRDRFWSSGDEGITPDKQAAYDTLYTVLVTMSKAAAPLLPLVTEEIYSGLVGGESVHLANFPDVAAIAEEAVLVADMDRVRDICTAALSVREKENIRVRQPLATLTVYSAGVEGLKAYADIIRDELNVKSVAFSSELEAIASRTLKVNFPVAGKRLGQKMKDIAAAAKQGNWKALTGGKAEVGGEVLEGEEFEITLQPKEGINGAQALSTNDALVVLDLTITPELKAEGIARDVVRAIQQARKDANLNITDRIALKLEAAEELRQAIEANAPYIREQVLASALDFLPVTGVSHTAESEVEGGKVTIGFDLAA